MERSGNLRVGKFDGESRSMEEGSLEGHLIPDPFLFLFPLHVCHEEAFLSHTPVVMIFSSGSYALGPETMSQDKSAFPVLVRVTFAVMRHHEQKASRRGKSFFGLRFHIAVHQ